MMMNTRKIFTYVFFLLTATVSISLIGCSSNSTSGNDNNNNNGNGEEKPNEVEMVNTSFSPQSLEVEVGTTVTWINKSSLTHTVTSGTNGEHDGTFDSGSIGPDGQFSYTFDEIGTFDYYCIPHVNQGMTGVVTVVESGE